MNDPIRVLVVDDEAALRELFLEHLEARGLSVTAAADGLEGLDFLRARASDVAAIHLRMPRLDGLASSARCGRRNWRAYGLAA